MGLMIQLIKHVIELVCARALMIRRFAELLPTEPRVDEGHLIISQSSRHDSATSSNLSEFL